MGASADGIESMHRELILGPPGTGKTTELLKIVEAHLNMGIPPDRIGFVSFTRKAAQEAQDRAGLSREALPWFRTIHSLAYYCHCLRPTDVMNAGQYRAFGEEFGLKLTGRSDSNGMFEERGDNQILNAIHLARNKLTTPRDEAINLGLEEQPWRIEQVAKWLREWKERELLWDFTDMLEHFQEGPKLEVLIVDEAQDLTPLQWRVVNKLAESVRFFYVAGDDDQAIYSWAGADIQPLINFQGNVRVLDQSYRTPRAVQAVSQVIASRITNRIDKVWKPREAEGRFSQGEDLEEIIPEEGTWMFLARTIYGCTRMKEHLEALGILYQSNAGSSISPNIVGAIRTWEALRRGARMPAPSVIPIYELMTAGIGYVRGSKVALDEFTGSVTILDLQKRFGLQVDEEWFRVLTKLGTRQIAYVRRILGRGTGLEASRCYVGTIHSVKGGEADHVVLSPDIPPATKRHTNGERRVWYVGATRSRDSLRILQPTTDLNVSLIFN